MPFYFAEFLFMRFLGDESLFDLQAPLDTFEQGSQTF